MNLLQTNFMQDQISTIGVLSLFETTKQERTTFVESIVNQVLDGQADPIKVHLQFKCAEDIFKQITGDEKFKSVLLDACDKHGKTFTFQNAKFERKEVGVKYDYSACNDPILASLEQKAIELSEKVKARQTLLKTAPLSGLVLVDEESGETFKVYPPSKTSTTSVAVTLK